MSERALGGHVGVSTFEVGTPVSPGVAERWFRALYDSPLMFSGILDARGRVLDANRLSVEGCGLVRTEVMSRPFWECGWWSPDPVVAGQVRAWCEQALATGAPIRARSRYFLGDGSERMVDLALYPVAEDDRAGAVCSYVVATGSDITDSVAAQEEHVGRLAVEAETLRESQRLFRGALDAMIDNVAIGRSVRDSSGAIVDFELEFLNQASVDGAGRPAAELMGARVCEVYPSWRTSGMFDRFARGGRDRPVVRRAPTALRRRARRRHSHLRLLGSADRQARRRLHRRVA